jgi:serine/threonine protein kinase
VYANIPSSKLDLSFSLFLRPSTETRRSQDVKISDFGLSSNIFGEKIVSSGGTPAFMAPEVFSGVEHSGHPSDVWALGVTMFMMATGAAPFTARTEVQLFNKILNDPIPWPGGGGSSKRDDTSK